MVTKAEWAVLIADDEPAARRGVRQLLAAFPEFIVAGECRDGGEVLAALDTLNPHVVFLDIQMPGVDGFEVIRRRTPERMPIVVFLTAYDQFAIPAFEAQALDYLLKPVTEARFAATMKRLQRQLKAASPATREPALVVTTTRGATVVPVREIDWIESADNYVALHVGGRTLLVRDTITAMAGKLDPQTFLRIRSSAIVNLARVTAIVPWSGVEFQLVLSDGTQLLSTRRYHSAIRKLMG
jgi:two-component system, LytTR family, response regulator